MAKERELTEPELVDALEAVPVAAEPELDVEPQEAAAPVPFVEPVHHFRQGPSLEQHAWMAANPHYTQISHMRMGKATGRGTLHQDGTFVPEGQHPVMDGPTCIAVGIPSR
jgi:hypothetical protein